MSKTEKCPRPVKLSDKEEQALRLRTLGLTYREIAKQLQVSISTAYSRVMRGLRDLRKRQHEAPSDVRHIELLKLAQLERRVMAEAVSGDHASIRLLLRIMESRKRYLATCLPSTSNKEELDELLRVFTHPVEETLFSEDGDYDCDELFDDEPLHSGGDGVLEGELGGVVSGGEVDGPTADAAKADPFPAVPDLAAPHLTATELSSRDLAVA